jgi:hypothetical protein
VKSAAVRLRHGRIAARAWEGAGVLSRRTASARRSREYSVPYVSASRRLRWSHQPSANRQTHRALRVLPPGVSGGGGAISAEPVGTTPPLLNSGRVAPVSRRQLTSRPNNVEWIPYSSLKRWLTSFPGSPYVEVTGVRCGLLNLGISLAADEDSRTREIKPQ